MSSPAELEREVESVNQTINRFLQAFEDLHGDRAGEYLKEPRAITRANGSTGQFGVVAISYPTKSSLTAREKQVARLIGRGFGNAGIARRLDLQPKTVEKHIERIKTKWDVSTRAAIARYVAILLPEDLYG